MSDTDVCLGRKRLCSLPRRCAAVGAGRNRYLSAATDPDWSLNAAGHLERQFKTEDFAQALALANAGAIAEAQWHHPDLTVRWGGVGVEIWTKIDGLVESDCLAAHLIKRSSRELPSQRTRADDLWSGRPSAVGRPSWILTWVGFEHDLKTTNS